MKKKLTAPWGVAISDGNGFGSYDETSLTVTECVQRTVMPIYVVNTTYKNYNHHPAQTQQEAINIAAWMKSKLFGLLFMWVRTTHRTIGSNMGQMPIVVVNGPYSDNAAYKMLGLTDLQIQWVESL